MSSSIKSNYAESIQRVLAHIDHHIDIDLSLEKLGDSADQLS